ncbi:hypothetical protein PIB30_027733 [Stylosanthes scabra]|uniref:Uncharacterized protein n=1 Tax=Stylosanthes scabra TaxID=79078 RepID=A0ABU6WB09_9FABA|nr:hypothetical protein [Stylosanthes scabra]
MQSNFPAVSDSESSTGRSSVSTGEAVVDPRTGTATATAAPLTRTLWYKCGKCYELLPSNTALIQHQSESCRFAIKPLEPLSDRLKLLTKPNYAPVQPLPRPPSRPYNPFLMNPTTGGVTTPFAPSPALSQYNPNTPAAFQGAGVGGTNHFFGGLTQFKPVPQTRDFLSLMDPGYASRAWIRSLQFPQEPSAFAGNGAGDAATAARDGSSEPEDLDLELKI